MEFNEGTVLLWCCISVSFLGRSVLWRCVIVGRHVFMSIPTIKYLAKDIDF